MYKNQQGLKTNYKRVDDMASESWTFSRRIWVSLIITTSLTCSAVAAQNSQVTARDLKSCSKELHTLKASLLVGYDQKLAKLKTKRDDDLQTAEVKFLERYKSELETSNDVDWYMPSISSINQMKTAKEVRSLIAQQKGGIDNGEAAKAAGAAQVCVAKLRLARLERASGKLARNEYLPRDAEDAQVIGPLSDQDCFQKLLKIQRSYKDKQNAEKDINIAQKKLFEGVCSNNSMAAEYVASANATLGISLKKQSEAAVNMNDALIPEGGAAVTGTLKPTPAMAEPVYSQAK
jgi:hypothetical protein